MPTNRCRTDDGHFRNCTVWLRQKSLVKVKKVRWRKNKVTVGLGTSPYRTLINLQMKKGRNLADTAVTGPQD